MSYFPIRMGFSVGIRVVPSVNHEELAAMRHSGRIVSQSEVILKAPHRRAACKPEKWGVSSGVSSFLDSVLLAAFRCTEFDG
jgi:hypothetical protein